MQTLRPFHLAIPVANLEESRAFYRDVLGCEEGRSDAHWVDFNLFGHQLVIHEVKDFAPAPRPTNEVDGHQVPVPHFGVVLPWDEFDAFVDRLTTKGVMFVIAPYLRLPLTEFSEQYHRQMRAALANAGVMLEDAA